jgi:5'(3')-deoxyribonucleotidase
MFTLAVDVDLTVVDTLTPWMEWFKQYTDEPVKNEDKAYNLDPEMRVILARAGRSDVDPVAYWKKPDLYDNLDPIPGAVENLKYISDNYNVAVVFASTCFPEHTASKERLIKRCFPFADGFIATHDKHFIGYDALIDDKLHHMQMGRFFRPKAQHIIFTGVRADGTDIDRLPLTKMKDWNKLERILDHTRPASRFTPAFAYAT